MSNRRPSFPCKSIAIFVLLGAQLPAFCVSAYSGDAPAERALPPQIERMGDVMVPVPVEIFRSLDQFRDSNWNMVIRPGLSELRPNSDPAVTALALGLVIGEGFIAAEAENSTEMQSLGKTAIRLARALGVEKSILRRSRSIMEHSEKMDWGAVRAEWSHASEDITEAMKEIRSDRSAQLVSLGGWLRGLEALSVLSAQHYNPTDAELLYQPLVLQHFSRLLPKIDEKASASPIPAELKENINRLKILYDKMPAGSVSQHDVKEIRTISRETIDAICVK